MLLLTGACHDDPLAEPSCGSGVCDELDVDALFAVGESTLVVDVGNVGGFPFLRPHQAQLRGLLATPVAQVPAARNALESAQQHCAELDSSALGPEGDRTWRLPSATELLLLKSIGMGRDPQYADAPPLMLSFGQDDIAPLILGAFAEGECAGTEGEEAEQCFAMQESRIRNQVVGRAAALDITASANHLGEPSEASGFVCVNRPVERNLFSCSTGNEPLTVLREGLRLDSVHRFDVYRRRGPLLGVEEVLRFVDTTGPERIVHEEIVELTITDGGPLEKQVAVLSAGSDDPFPILTYDEGAKSGALRLADGLTVLSCTLFIDG